jgi:hypothetical protein
VKFYLEQPSEVHLIVRELDYKYHYWLDKVELIEPWQRGFTNVFEWPTQEVVQQLEGLTMHALGVVTRLEKSYPDKVEKVSPAIFYHTKFPTTIERYKFTFKTREDVRLRCSVYKVSEKDPVFARIFRKKKGGRPFTVQWDSSTAPAGWYKLVVTGSSLETAEHIAQEVHFYHTPEVK